MWPFFSLLSTATYSSFIIVSLYCTSSANSISTRSLSLYSKSPLFTLLPLYLYSRLYRLSVRLKKGILKVVLISVTKPGLKDTVDCPACLSVSSDTRIISIAFGNRTRYSYPVLNLWTAVSMCLEVSICSARSFRKLAFMNQYCCLRACLPR